MPTIAEQQEYRAKETFIALQKAAVKLPGFTYYDHLANIDKRTFPARERPLRKSGSEETRRHLLRSLGEYRQANFSRQRAALATRKPGKISASAIGVPSVPLTDFGFSLPSGSFKATDIFHESGSSLLEYLDEGSEAFVYRDPKTPGVVYKFYARNESYLGKRQMYGYGYVEEMSFDKSRERIKMRPIQWSDNPADLLDKLALIDALGVPTEIVGVSPEGVVIAKQQNYQLPVHLWDVPSKGLETGDIQVKEVPLDVFGMAEGEAAESKIVFYDGKWWVLGDLHHKNRLEGSDGKARLIDFSSGEIPQALQAINPEAQAFFTTPTAKLPETARPAEKRAAGAGNDATISRVPQSNKAGLSNNILSEGRTVNQIPAKKTRPTAIASKTRWMR